MADLSIVIKAINGYRSLNKLLNSIEYQTSNSKFEIVILANANDIDISNYFNYHTQCWGSFRSIKLLQFTDKDDYLLKLNRTVLELKTNYVMVVEDKFILGRHFFERAITELDDNTLVHPEFCIYYNKKNAIKQFNDEFDYNALFEQNIFENIILASRSVFSKVHFNNFDGAEFWQFYCDSLAKGADFKAIKSGVLFKNFKAHSQEELLLASQLFEPSKLSNIDVVKAVRRPSLYVNANPAGTTIKQLIRRAINKSINRYIDISKNPSCKALLEEWKFANAVEPLLFPEARVISNIELTSNNVSGELVVYKSLLEQYNFDTKFVFLIPLITVGGGIRVTNNYINVLLSKYQGSQITIITTDSAVNNEELLQAGVNIIHLKSAAENLHEEVLLKGLLKFLMQVKPSAIHNINSELAYKMFARYAKYLSQASNLYLTHFVPNLSPEGKITGHMLEYLPHFYKYLSAVSTDNKSVVAQMDKLYGFGKDKYEVHYQPVEIKEKNNKKNISLNKGVVNILWASRIDYQKNIPVLIEIAKYFAKHNQLKPVKFTIAGIVEKNSVKDFELLKQLPNVEYIGGFQNIVDLPLNDSDIFLYTSRSDGIPTILLEIMGQRTVPIIASGIDTIKELLLPDRGIICADIEAFIKEIKKFIDNPKVANEMIENAYEYVKYMHSQEKFAEKVKVFNKYF